MCERKLTLGKRLLKVWPLPHGVFAYLVPIHMLATSLDLS